LTEAQKDKVFNILEGIVDKSEIDKKFGILKESEFFPTVEVGNEKGKEAIEKSKKKSDPKEGEDQVMEGDEEGKGKMEVEDEEEDEKKKEEKKVEESSSPFDAYKAQYLKVLQENRI
jgi:hypothetical protein